jgi:hypothetical protein
VPSTPARAAVIGTWLFLVAAGAAAQPGPISLHPGNPHVFQFRGKATVLVTSGEHYGAVMNQDFDFIRYLDELERHGLNLTRTFSGVYVEGWGEPWNTLNPGPGRYLAPWARSGQPGYADGGNRFDLSTWDESYWRRLKTFVRHAGRRGIVVEYVLFCVHYGDREWNLSPLKESNNVNGIGRAARKDYFRLTDPGWTSVQERFVRKAASELQEFDNVYFELCNEPYFDDPPPIDSEWNRRMIAAIRSVTSRHLIALNVANGSGRVDKVPEGVSILNYHYAHPPDAVVQNWDHARAVCFDETGFKGSTAPFYRRTAWDFMLAGGAAYSNLDWSFSARSPVGRDLTADEKLGPKDPALRPQLGVLKRFLERLPIVRMKPAPEMLTGALPPGVSVRVLAERGSLAAAYVMGPGLRELRLELPQARYTWEWIDPATGRRLLRAERHHDGGTAALMTPSYTEDLALRIRAK